MSLSDFDFYVSNTGRLVIPSLNVNYLMDLNQSSLYNMPEAIESSVKVAGRDGDIDLSTTYEPIFFNLVCYTDMGLTAAEKTTEERKINNFLHSIKNSTKTLVIEKDSKFYNVKYSGSLTTINYPTHMQFNIPLKSANPYGLALEATTLVGNDSGESNTIEEVGAVFTIEGPATHPQIYLNNYFMEYANDLLLGQKLIIDSRKSTVTHVNAFDVKTNAMIYYNHEFPKIQKGTNLFGVISGIDDPSQASVTWNDLIL